MNSFDDVISSKYVPVLDDAHQMLVGGVWSIRLDRFQPQCPHFIFREAAVWKELQMFHQCNVSRFPIVNSAVTECTLDVVAKSSVVKPSRSKAFHTADAFFWPIAEWLYAIGNSGHAPRQTLVQLHDENTCILAPHCLLRILNDENIGTDYRHVQRTKCATIFN